MLKSSLNHTDLSLDYSWLFILFPNFGVEAKNKSERERKNLNHIRFSLLHETYNDFSFSNHPLSKSTTHRSIFV